MTRALRVCAAAVVAALLAAGPAGAAGAPTLQARAAFLVQPDTRDVIYARHPDARRSIASTTKIMTALVALDHYKLSQTLTIPPYTPGVGESLVGLRTGERMTFADLLRAMMLPSANDAAHAVAVSEAGSVPAFVALMNHRARQLGLRNTHFTNPIGLDEPGNYSSARDIVELALLLRRNAFVRGIVAQPRAELRTGDHPRIVVNRNDLVARYSFVNGIKTGHTIDAGYVLVGSATRHGVTVLSSVLGDPSISARDADSIALLRYGLSLYHRVTAVHTNRALATPPVKDEGDTRARLVAAAPLSAVVRRGEHLRVRVVGAPDQVSGPLPAGRREGTVELLRRGQVVARAALVTAAAVPRPTITQRVRAWVGRPLTILLLLVLAACTVQVVLLRRRVVRNRQRARGADVQ